MQRKYQHVAHEQASYTLRAFDAAYEMRSPWNHDEILPEHVDAGYSLDAVEIMPAGMASSDPFDDSVVFTREGV